VKHNAIPDEVLLRVNFRFFKPEVQEKILTAIQRIANGIALSSGMPSDRLPVIRHISEGAPTLENDPLTVMRVIDTLRVVLGDEQVIEIPPLAGSEDFGYFSERDHPVNLCYLRLGTDTGNKTAEPEPYLHSPQYAPPPEAIKTGTVTMTAGAPRQGWHCASRLHGSPPP
ncbi:MAG TPA: hypothetical protein VE134_03175, partial [Methanomicrobiales archaeon]|nr:hypothetical protein [Methanomicrobiales archaeon]